MIDTRDMGARGLAFRPRDPKETAQAIDADAQRRRIDARIAMVRSASLRWTGVVIGGRGTPRRLSCFLAPLIGHATFDAGAPLETVETICCAASVFSSPRVIVLAPMATSRPILAELNSRRVVGRDGGALVALDALRGLRTGDREAFLRRAILTFRDRPIGGLS